MQVFQLRALQVPPVKCQQKLLQATRSILSLLRERDYLLASLRTLQNYQQTDMETGNQPETDVKTGNQPETDMKTGNQPETTDVKTGNQPETDVKTGNQPETTDVKTGNQPETTDVKTGNQPETTDVKTGYQPETDVKTGNRPETDVKTGNQPDTGTKTGTSPQTLPLPLPAVDISLSSLHFSDSEVEGQKSLDQLMENCLSSSPPAPGSHPPRQSAGTSGQYLHAPQSKTTTTP